MNINVFYGPMKCGKTEKLLNEFQIQKNSGYDVKLFKPSIDTRFDKNKIVSRAGNSADAININCIDDLNSYDADVYLIDEFQFLDGNIDTIKNLANKGKKFYIYGLNLTSDKKNFGRMYDVIDIADNSELIPSTCQVCKNETALFSFFKGKKDTDIVLGDEEYVPVCANCYEKLKFQYQ